MRVFVIGTGGRESAIIHSLFKEAADIEIHSNTHNPIAGIKSADLKNNQIEQFLDYFEDNDIDFVIVGPEQPLSLGIVDKFNRRFGNRKVIFGPVLNAARLESDKSWAKSFMQKNDIRTADYAVFTDYNNALDFISDTPEKYVIKASGLAAGKGVFLPNTQKAAEKILISLLKEKKMDAAGEKVVIEKRLSGKEFSLFVVMDGRDFKILLPARDYKRALDNDKGKNTGGMGSYAPSFDVIDEEQLKYFASDLFSKVQNGLAEERILYKGILYAGLIKNDDGIFVLEFNVRLGDPETQVLIPLLKSSFLDISYAAATGTLSDATIEWESGYCVNVVLCSGGYPDKYDTGFAINGLQDIEDSYFLAGTRKCAQRDNSTAVCTNSGRVLNIYCKADSLSMAITGVYKNVRHIHFKNMQFREDIGK